MKTSKIKKIDMPQINLRLPADLKERLDLHAKQSGRSTTAEIIKAIETVLGAETKSHNSEMNSIISFQPSATFQLGKSEDELDRLAEKIAEKIKGAI